MQGYLQRMGQVLAAMEAQHQQVGARAHFARVGQVVCCSTFVHGGCLIGACCIQQGCQALWCSNFALLLPMPLRCRATPLGARAWRVPQRVTTKRRV